MSSRCCRSLLGQQVFEQVECRRIQPLQVVEEERQRMLGSREHADEPPKDQLKSSLRFLRRQLGHRWLFANDVLQFRDEIDDEQPVRLQRLTKRVAPFAQVFFVLAEERPDEALKRLRQRGIRNVALVLVELARCKQAAWRNERLVELIHDCGFADAGVSGDQHQLRPAARDDAIERGEQGVDLAVPPVQLLGDHEAIRSVMSAGSEVVDDIRRTPIATGSAEDRSQLPPLSDTAPRPSWRAASS